MILADFATVLENWVDDRYEVQVSHNALGDTCVYARYKDWVCSKDHRLKELLREETIMSEISQQDCGHRGQWCGVRHLHEDFDDLILPRFQAEFDLRDVDLFACGHPLYWCRLVATFDAPILGVWDMTHHLFVPEELQHEWTGQFLELFQRKGNLLVALSAYHGFQLEWLLGLRVPYFQLTVPDVSLVARYSPHARPNEVFVSRFNTLYDVDLLYRFAEAASLPFRFVDWNALSCGKDCSKAQLARFRASVLCAYDTSNMKLTEFYAMAVPIFIFGGGLWRTTMRWAQADAKAGGPNATLGGRDFRDPPEPYGRQGPKDGRWISQGMQQATEEILWERPWQEPLRGNAPPYGRLPYSPFMESRNELIPPAAAFWAQLTDWALLPHIQRYESVPHLLHMLSELSLEDLLEISRRMASHYAQLLVASTNFWRAVIVSLVEDRDASKWKG